MIEYKAEYQWVSKLDDIDHSDAREFELLKVQSADGWKLIDRREKDFTGSEIRIRYLFKRIVSNITDLKFSPDGGVMETNRYVKLPVEVEAFQFTNEMAIGDKSLLPPMIKRCPYYDYQEELNKCDHVIETLEGDHMVLVGDWVITGVHGEHYPCKDEIFKKTYRRV